MRKFKFFRHATGAFAALVMLAGCQAFNAAEVAMQVDAAEARVTMDRFIERPGPLRAPDTVQTVDGIWLGGGSVRVAKGDPLPRSTDMVTLISAEPLGIQDIATEVTTLTGIPVIIDFEAGFGGGVALPEAPPFEVGQATVAEQGTPSDAFATLEMPALDGGGGGFVSPSSDTIQLSYSGPLGGLLDLLSTRFNVSWEYRNGSIRFFELETQVFTIHALANILDSTSTVGTTAEGDGETGGFTLSSGMDASQSIAIDMFNEITAQVSDLVSTNGTVSSSPSSGTISVSARPHVLAQVSAFLSEQNERLSRQISLHVQVLSVELSQTDDVNFDLQLFIENSLQISTVTPGQGLSPAATGAISAVVLDRPDTPDSIRDNISGTTVIANAVAQEEKTTVVTSSNLITTNGIPIPFQSVNQTRFVAEVTEESDEETGDTTLSVEVEDLITGFSIAMTPRIIADGGIMLQYSINLSELVSLVTVPLGGAQFVQIPSVDVTSYIQQALVRSGQTLALAGFEQATNDTLESGQGLPENIALGGTKQGSVGREVTIVLITPKIINSSDLLRGDIL